MRNFILSSFILTLFHSLLIVEAASALEGRFEIEGAEFVLRLEDGRVVRREALVGLTLRLASQREDGQIQITGFEDDTTATGGTVPLYRLSARGPGDRSENLCQPDARGRRAGFPLADGSGGFSFTCTSGAAGKCVLMGYRPWEKWSGLPLRALHRACVHMLRADYGGDDKPTTRDGTAVDIFDRFDIQKAAMRHDMSFEAAWDADGAVCVAHPRIAENVALADLAQRYPRLNGHLGPQACTEEVMRGVPEALLYNRSVAPSRLP